MFRKNHAAFDDVVTHNGAFCLAGGAKPGIDGVFSSRPNPLSVFACSSIPVASGARVVLTLFSRDKCQV